MNDDAPPTRATTHDSAGAHTQVVEGEQEERRPEDAPPCRQQHLGDGECPQGPVVAHEPQPVADLVEDRLPIRDRRRGRLLVADRQRRMAETTYVTALIRIVIGPVMTWTRIPLSPKSANLRDRPAAARALLPDRGASRSTMVGR